MGAPNDGGPAFPADPTAYAQGFEGMSLRDYFAGQALAGILACGTMTHTQERAEENAGTAYAMADAMLAEREKRRAG